MTEIKNLRCVGDRVIVKIKPTAYKEIALQIDEKDKIPLEHPYQGIVVCVGDGKRFDSVGFDPPDCKPGDTVLYDKHSGSPIMFDFGEGIQNYLVIRESNIHLVIRK